MDVVETPAQAEAQQPSADQATAESVAQPPLADASFQPAVPAPDAQSAPGEPPSAATINGAIAVEAGRAAPADTATPAEPAAPHASHPAHTDAVTVKAESATPQPEFVNGGTQPGDPIKQESAPPSQTALAPAPSSTELKPSASPLASVEPTPAPSTPPMDVTPAPVSTPVPVVPAVPRTRKEALLVRVAEERTDADAWLELLGIVEREGKDMVGAEVEVWWQEMTGLYERFFEVWPHASKQYQAYIELSLSTSHFAHVENIYSRALRPTPSVDLWQSYIAYVRRTNEPRGPEGRDTVVKAIEYALSHIGHDREAGEIWRDYAHYLRDGPATNTWEEQQRMDAMRRTYQRAVVLPINNVEAMWREWDAFEGNLNRVTAKKFLADRSPAYMSARSALRELRTLSDGPLFLFRADSLPVRPTWTEGERARIAGWKRYLAWEETNPLDIEDENVLRARITYAYRKAIMHMRFYPEIWFKAAHYQKTIGRDDEALLLLKQGSEANPGSFLLTFALAEAEETRKDYAAAHATYSRLIEHISSEIKKTEASIANELGELEAPLRAPLEVIPGENEGETRERRRTVETDVAEKKDAVSKRRAKEVEELAKGAGNVWTSRMRFARRAEGIKAARAVFKEARGWSHCTWHVYEAGAMMEYHGSKDPVVATKIFELGLKKFPLEVDFVTHYLDFLIFINDDGNARALFERVAPTLPSDKARPLWSRWAMYEYGYGDLAAALKFEARLAEAFPEEQPIKRLAERHTHLRIDKIASTDLGFGIKPPSTVAAAQSSMPAAANKRVAADEHADRKDDRAKRSRRESASPAPSVGGGGDRKPSGPPPAVKGRYNSPAPQAPPPSRPLNDPLSLFLSQLPNPRAFDGPIVSVDDCIIAIRSMVLPSMPAQGGPGPAARGGPPLPPPDVGRVRRGSPDYAYRGPAGGYRR